MIYRTLSIAGLFAIAACLYVIASIAALDWLERRALIAGPRERAFDDFGGGTGQTEGDRERSSAQA